MTTMRIEFADTPEGKKLFHQYCAGAELQELVRDHPGDVKVTDTPSVECEARQFNVLCVTKMHKGPNSSYDNCDWHLPITGVAHLLAPEREILGVRFSAGVSCLVFKASDGKDYMGICQSARSGLNGRAVTLEFDLSPGDISCRTERWALYTDMPTEGYTIEDVLKEAAEEIAKHKRE